MTPLLDYETAHISFVYRAVQLKDSSVCHLLGNLFTQYAGLNTGVMHMHAGLHTIITPFKYIFPLCQLLLRINRYFLIAASDRRSAYLHLLHIISMFHKLILRILSLISNYYRLDISYYFIATLCARMK